MKHARLFLFSFILLHVCVTATYAQNVDVTASAGPTTGSYSTLKGAFDAINAGTHQGVITIEIVGNTTETATAALNASGSGSASYTSISISPSGGAARTISGNISGPLIDLNGADDVTIDGLNTGGNSLIIENTNATTGSTNSTIRFINGATNNTITNCTILGSTLNTSSGVVFFSTSTVSGGNSNNIISNNNITQAGASRPINMIYSLGTSTAGFHNNNNFVQNNEIFDFFHASTTSNAIFVSSNSSQWTISNNSFYLTTTFTSSSSVTYRVILVSNSSGNNFTISGNHIGGSEANCGGTAWTKNGTGNIFDAIHLSASTNTTSNIQGNIISNFNWSNSNNSAWHGIWVQSGLVNVGTVTGNTIGAASGNGNITFTGGTTGANFYGIYLGLSTVNCQNNTIASITTVASNSLNATNFWGIFKTNAGNVTISNNTIGSATVANSIEASSISSSNAQSVVGIHNQGTGSITISNNFISNMLNATTNTGTTVLGYLNGIRSTNGTNIITNNIIKNLSISNRNNTQTVSASIAGISLDDANTNTTSITHEIYGNTIQNLTNTDAAFAGHIFGIYKRSSLGITEVSSNFVENLSVNAASTNATIWGISSKLGSTEFVNNLVVIGGNTETTIYGMHESTNNTGTVTILYHNTVVIKGSPTQGSRNSFAFFSTGNTRNRDFRNNNLVNKRSNNGASGTHYAMWINESQNNLNGVPIDYNNYFVDGSGGILGRLGSNNITTLPFINVTDQNSFNLEPDFVNFNGTNIADFSPQERMEGNITLNIAQDIEQNARTIYQVGAVEPCITTVTTGSLSADQSSCTAPYTPSDIEITGQSFASIQWQSSSNGLDFNDISGQTNNLLPLSTLGSINQTSYFRAKIKDNGCVFGYSDIITVSVDVDLEELDLLGQDVCQNCPVKSLSVIGIGTGLSYQWYTNTSHSNSGGTAVSGATNPTFTPSSNTIGTQYFYCEVSNSCGTVASSASGAFRVGLKPIITSLPQSGDVGSTITITGSGFSTDNTENWVYISDQKANVISSTATQLEVEVPYGSKIQPIYYVNASNGLSTESPTKFVSKLDDPLVICSPLLNRNYRSGTPTFFDDADVEVVSADINGNGFLDVAFVPTFNANFKSIRLHRNISTAGGAVSFDVNQDITTSITFNKIIFDDINNDGKPDIIGVGRDGANSTRELQIFINETANNATTFSFSAPIIYQYNDFVTTSSVRRIQLFDVDSDGKKDVVLFDQNGPGGSVYIFKNNSTNEHVDFSESIRIDGMPSSSGILDYADLNNNGKIDIVIAVSTDIYILENNSTPSGISFAAPEIINTGLGSIRDLRLHDFDQDGKIDISFLNGFSNGRTYRNTHTTGPLNASSFSSALSPILFSTSSLYGYNVLDMNADGLPDFVWTIYSNSSTWGIRQNTGTVSGADNFNTDDFVSVGSASTNSRQFLVSGADFNNDGKPDMVGKGSQTNTGLTFITNNCLGESAKMIFDTAPQTTITGAGALNPSPVIQIVDGNNNPIAVSGVTITLAIHSGTSTLTGTLTRSTDANGRVTFSGLSIPCATDVDMVLRFVSPCIKDTLFTDPITANSVTLSGTIQVGANEAAPFNDLINALQAYELADITGDVIFELTDASYNLGANSAIMRSNEDADATHTLTIKPATGVTPVITSSNSNGTIIFYGTDFITIDGSADGTGNTRDLTIQNTSTSGTVLRLENLSGSCGLECSNLAIKNSVIMGNSVTNASAIGINLIGASHNNITLDNNAIEKCGYGISTTNTSTPIDNLSILNNEIGSNIASDYIGFAGIRLARITNSVIANNTIYNISSTTTTDGGPHGVFISNGSASNVNIANNHIYNIIATSTSGSGGKGIRTLGSGHTIYNNIIHSIGGVGSTTNTSGVHGIYIGSTNTNVYHNTVFLSGNYNGLGTSVNISAALYLVSTGANVRNNIFYNAIEPAGKSSPKSFAVYSTAGFSTIDFNNYFVSTGNGVLGFLGSDRTTFSAWQTATGGDANSLNTWPLFVNNTGTSPTDYRPKAMLDCDVISGFEFDFGNADRNLNPQATMGTWESIEIVWEGTNSTDFATTSNWSLNAFPGNGSKVKFSPTAANHLVLDQNRTLGNVDFNGSGKNLILGNFDLTVSSISGADASNYIQTNGSGALKTTIPASSSFTFPIGNSAYNPLTITNKNAVDDFSVRVIDDVFLNGLSGSSIVTPHVKVTWDIDKTNTNNAAGVDFEFQWNENQEVGTLTANDYKLNHHNGTNWEFAIGTSGSVSGGTPKTMAHTGYTGTFSPFAIGTGENGVPLPVELLQFNAKAVNNEMIALHWVTATEINNEGFEVQRSTDGISFETIGWVDGNGNTSKRHSYYFDDTEPYSGINYYRLKQVDFDGQYEYSNIVAARIKMGALSHQMIVYPNPASDRVNIDIESSYATITKITISDIAGKQLLVKEINMEQGWNAITLNTAHLVSGVYFISIESKDQPMMQKVVIAR